ncbi:hypothetical protein MJO28_012799 [Puccinia striiformis f. sp. tritici]|uniref:Uncharacterized protein n=1 Tax=Puccinia striiformis f. sp. tritici TaxID=168172 RepID=A0ACC0DYI9_9BASI|nr:hypothetical protein MJO28_012799 [Puccinia striiformis f. sp. tritici]
MEVAWSVTDSAAENFSKTFRKDSWVAPWILIIPSIPSDPGIQRCNLSNMSDRDAIMSAVAGTSDFRLFDKLAAEHDSVKAHIL